MTKQEIELYVDMFIGECLQVEQLNISETSILTEDHQLFSALYKDENTQKEHVAVLVNHKTKGLVIVATN